MKKISSSIIFLTLFLFFLSPGLVLGANTKVNLDITKNTAYAGATVPTSIPMAIGKIVGAALAFVGVLFFILMIYGGVLWMTARGNEQQTQKAKDLIVSAIIGLVIVLSAYAVTAYIGGELTT